MQHHDVPPGLQRRQGGRVVRGADRFGRPRFARSQQDPETRRVPPQHLVDAFLGQLSRHRAQVDDRTSTRRCPQRRRDVPEGGVEVDQRRGPAGSSERRRQVRGQERRAHAASWPVHRDHQRPLHRRAPPGGKGSTRRPSQILPFGGPQVEGSGARVQSHPHGLDGFGGLQRQERAAVQVPGRPDQQRLAHHGVRLALVDGPR